MIAILGVTSGIYFVTIFWLIQGIRKGKTYDYDGTILGKNKFSIVIPFRNEAKNLPKLLQSLSAIQYPATHFELIFIDDASEDSSKNIIQEFIQTATLPVRVLENKPYSKAPKKDAITLGVKKALHPWIVTTDADCQIPTAWLSVLDAFIDTEKAQFVAMPVLLKRGNSLATSFQYFETIVLQGLTLATFSFNKPFLCNGANLAYQKNLFFEVNGYEGNNHLASGDDIFLLEKIRKQTSAKLSYLNAKETIVKTYPESTWTQAIQQRIRWTSKTKSQKNTTAILLGLISFLGNVSFIISFLFIFVYPLDILYWIFFISFKCITDVLLLRWSATAFQEDVKDSNTFIALFLQPFLYAWIIVNSLWGSYTWKGRDHSK